MIKPTFPTEKQMIAMQIKIESLLAVKKINMYVNAPFKYGLTFSQHLINGRILNPENPFRIAETEEELPIVGDIYREQLKDVALLKSEQSRAIGILCVDWLNGQNDGTWIKIKLKRAK